MSNIDLIDRLKPGRVYRRIDGDWVHTNGGPELITSFVNQLARDQFEEVAA
jgi:hypothetical protein